MPDKTETQAIPLDDVLNDQYEPEAEEKEQDDYGEMNVDLPEELQLQLLALARIFVKQETTARRMEVYEAWQQRLYWRGLQYIYWSQDDQCFQSVTGGQQNKQSEDIDMPKRTQVFNIYYRYMSSLISVLTQNAPGVRFEPRDPNCQPDITTADNARKFQHVIERNNDMKKLQSDLARLFCTDGRVAVHTAYVEDETDPSKGKEIFTPYGVLEVKLPILLNEFRDFPYLLLSKEHDISQVKDMFPEMSEQISAGGESLGEQSYSRHSRLSALQGSKQSSLTGGEYGHMVTVHKLWLRPMAFTQAAADKREKLKELFPNGAYVCFVGDEYVGSCDESMDDCWSVRSAIPADGQFSPSLGRPMVDIQDSFNDLMNQSLEIYDHAIPSLWIDTSICDIDAIRDQISQPGSKIPAKDRTAGEALEANFYLEPAVTVPGDMQAAMQMLQGQLAQFITGALPALFGGEMGGNDTASGYAMARDQAMGQMGLTWSAMQSLYANMFRQAVRLAADNREGEVTVFGQGNQKEVKVSLSDLSGEMLCFPESDSSFPDTFSARRNVYMQLMTGATSNPILSQAMNEPNNLALGKDLLGLPDFIIPGVESRNKQRREIDQLLKETPMPNPQFVEAMKQAIASGQMPNQMPPPEAMLESSMKIDPIFDNHQYEFAEIQYFLNSQEGDDAKTNNPKGWLNVRMHGLDHYNAMNQQSQDNQQQPPPKLPSENINYKDLPPEGQQQLAAKAGIQLSAPPPPQLPPQ